MEISTTHYEPCRSLGRTRSLPSWGQFAWICKWIALRELAAGCFWPPNMNNFMEIPLLKRCYYHFCFSDLHCFSTLGQYVRSCQEQLHWRALLSECGVSSGLWSLPVHRMHCCWRAASWSKTINENREYVVNMQRNGDLGGWQSELVLPELDGAFSFSHVVTLPRQFSPRHVQRLVRIETLIPQNSSCTLHVLAANR